MGLCNAHWLLEYVLASGALAALQVTEIKHLMHYLKRCAYHSRKSCGQKMALKIASVDSRKHHSLKHQTRCLMALCSLRGECVPHVLLAGALTGHVHGYGLGTTLLAGRHPAPGTNLLLAEEALRKVHRCSILVNDLHPDNVVLVADGNMARVFFIDFSHSTPLPTLAQCAEELCSLRDVFSLKAE